MRTKTLLLAAALTAAGAATSLAQSSNVYSLNVVGYYNINVPANTYLLVGNQLSISNNLLKDVIPNPPPGAQFQQFAGGFTAYTFDDVDLAWTPGGGTNKVDVGTGGFYRSPVTTTLTFVGEVPQGLLTNTLPQGIYVIRASKVPQAGTPVSLQIPAEPGDQIQTFSGGFTAFTFDDVDLVWTPGDPNGPSLSVGQAFFYRKSPTATNPNWVRNFTVN